MRPTGQKKYICFLLALMMLVSGMCFEGIKTDACFSSGRFPYAANAVYTNKDVVTKQYAFVEERSEKCEISSLASEYEGNRKESGARSLNSNMNLAAEMTTVRSLVSLRETAREARFGQTSSAVIISYVHHQDGSKG